MDPSSINGKTFKLFKKGATTKIAAQVCYPDPNSPLYGETRPERLPTKRGHLQGGSHHGGKGLGWQPPHTAVQMVFHGELVENAEKCSAATASCGGSGSYCRAPALLFLPFFLVLSPYFTEVRGRGVRRSSSRKVQLGDALLREGHVWCFLRENPQGRKGKKR
jgi:hypothetical protein